MTKKDNALQKFAHQRYKLFQDQNQQNGRFDVTFQFDKKQLFAHSFVLWPLSEVFESTLYGPLAEKGPITPKRYQFDDFKEFLTYLYIGNCKIDAQNVMSLVDLSEYYQIKPLKNVCDAFITESAAQTENILTLYESLKRYTLKTAMAKVMETIASKTDEILKSKDFLSIEKETILDIVKMDTLNSKEEELFQAVLKWASKKHENDETKIKAEMADILPFIRFPIMDLDFLHNFVVSKGYIFSSFEELSKILRDAKAFSQNGSSTQKFSQYTNKFRGGLRIEMFNYQKNKGYANIQDPKIIEAIKNAFTKQPHPFGREIPLRSIAVPKPIKSIDSPAINAKYYLIREPNSGTLNIQNYELNGHHRFLGQNNPLLFFQKFDVIAIVQTDSDEFNQYYDDITVKIV